MTIPQATGVAIGTVTLGLSNVHVILGAHPVLVDTGSPDELPELEHGQILVGLDVIGGMLTELNITSPTGVRQLSQLDGRDCAAPIVDYFERWVRERTADALRAR